MRRITECVGDEGTSSRVLGFSLSGGEPGGLSPQEDGQRAEQSNRRRGLFDARVGEFRGRRQGFVHRRGGRLTRWPCLQARTRPASSSWDRIRQIVGKDLEDHQRIEKCTYHGYP